MTRPDPGDRTASAIIGAALGAVVGLCLAWLLGVYSQTLGPGSLSTRFTAFAMGGAALFGLIGWLRGPAVGNLLAAVFVALYRFENPNVPGWLLAVVLVAVCGAVWWSVL